MKIESIRIQNLRAFKDETIPFNDYTCLVGPNGAGKSTVLCALNIFFRENQGSANNLLNLSKEDFHGKKIDDPIRIRVTFCQLSSREQSDLAHYYRNEKLIITAEARWDETTNTAEVKQYGERLTFKPFSPIFKLFSDGASAKIIKDTYAPLIEQYSTLPKASTVAQIQDALHAYQSAHSTECTPAQSNDEFYGFRGAGKLSPFIQWIFVPAVKDASTENIEAKNTALGKLLARTVRAKISFEKETEELRARTLAEYTTLLEKNQSGLNSISVNLEKRLREWAHPDATVQLAWRNDPKSAVTLADPIAEIIAGESDFFKGSLMRFGHGLQRCYLLALLQELANSDDSNSPRLLLGCEEPELYQHPPQARHLAGVFERLSTQNSQIVVCTHSPHFVSGKYFENVRLIRKNPIHYSAFCTHVSCVDLEKTVAAVMKEKVPTTIDGMIVKIHATLQTDLNEMFFAPVLILVEGIEDRSFITAYLHLLGKWDEFRRFGCHIVPTNRKSNMIRPVAIAKAMSIPTFIIFDADSDCNLTNVNQHKKDNAAILRLAGYDSEDPMPTTTLWKPDLVMWTRQIDHAVFDEFTPAEIESLKDKTRKAYGEISGLKKEELFIASLLVEAWNAGKKSTVLTALCDRILEFAAGQRGKS